jgi:Asp-tRNA(Asn)/Glu-tRNA(Gln) amidotransferase A subunit family amidase
MAAASAAIGPIARNVAETIARIVELNPALNAYIAVFEAPSMEQARALDEELRQGRSRGPLHGRTISLKDLIDVRGVPTTAASRSRDGHVAAEDAALVTRLREAGAVLVGKTNLHELALGTTSDESAFGPVRNPRDPSRSPGGSSGGSAAAVAAGMGWGSIGSDTGGSIRIPASACGVVGLKPSFGEIPMAGVVPLSVSLDHVGPIAQTVSDAWAIHAALTGAAPPNTASGSMRPARLGRLDGYFLAKLDDAVRARFEEAIGRARDAGATIVDVDLGSVPDIATTYLNVALVEAYAYHAAGWVSISNRRRRRRSRHADSPESFFTLICSVAARAGWRRRPLRASFRPCVTRGLCSTRSPSLQSVAKSSRPCRSMWAIAAINPACIVMSRRGRTAPRNSPATSPISSSPSSNGNAFQRSTSPAAHRSSIRISAAW